jgi:hypothetical protein
MRASIFRRSLDSTELGLRPTRKIGSLISRKWISLGSSKTKHISSSGSSRRGQTKGKSCSKHCSSAKTSWARREASLRKCPKAGKISKSNNQLINRLYWGYLSLQTLLSSMFTIKRERVQRRFSSTTSEAKAKKLWEGTKLWQLKQSL